MYISPDLPFVLPMASAVVVNAVSNEEVTSPVEVIDPLTVTGLFNDIVPVLLPIEIAPLEFKPVPIFICPVLLPVVYKLKFVPVVGVVRLEAVKVFAVTVPFEIMLFVLVSRLLPNVIVEPLRTIGVEEPPIKIGELEDIPVPKLIAPVLELAVPMFNIPVDVPFNVNVSVDPTLSMVGEVIAVDWTPPVNTAPASWA